MHKKRVMLSSLDPHEACRSELLSLWATEHWIWCLKSSSHTLNLSEGKRKPCYYYWIIFKSFASLFPSFVFFFFSARKQPFLFFTQLRKESERAQLYIFDISKEDIHPITRWKKKKNEGDTIYTRPRCFCTISPLTQPQLSTKLSTVTFRVQDSRKSLLLARHAWNYCVLMLQLEKYIPCFHMNALASSVV